MTHEVDGCDLIARCPVDARERAERKAYTAQSLRCEAALRMSMEVDMEELSNKDNLNPEEVKGSRSVRSYATARGPSWTAPRSSKARAFGGGGQLQWPQAREPTGAH
eukprot:8104626-Pyramimonas_sp.AAC.1